jgi:predicted nucleotide-binding protein with TIR-like domain
MASELPSVFVGSSVEGIGIAKAIQRGLRYAADVDLWDQATFDLSNVTIESLEERSRSADFAIFVLTPDDVKIKREKTTAAARDNVIFELGLFAGTLGRQRCFVVYDSERSIDLPTDLAGMTPATFRMHRSGDLDASLGAVCSAIEKAMQKLKARRKLDLDTLAAIDESRAFCARVAGYWWERVLPDDMSALSFVCIEPDPVTNTVKMSGVAYHTDGAPIADWYSIGVSIDANARKLGYIWEGCHPSRPNEPYQGFGWVRFDAAPGNFSVGRGTYFDANITDIASARRKSTTLRRHVDQREIDVMTGNDSTLMSAMVLEKLKSW